MAKQVTSTSFSIVSIQTTVKRIFIHFSGYAAITVTLILIKERVFFCIFNFSHNSNIYEPIDDSACLG